MAENARACCPTYNQRSEACQHVIELRAAAASIRGLGGRLTVPHQWGHSGWRGGMSVSRINPTDELAWTAGPKSQRGVIEFDLLA